MTMLRLALVIATAAIAACLAPSADAQTLSSPSVAGPTVVTNRILPPNDPARGLVYTGLATEATGECARAYRLVVTRGCTRGPEAPPAGLDVAVDVPLLDEREPKLTCDGDGTAGKRVQVVYARAADVPDRYADVVDSIRQWAGDVDRNIRNLAGATDGERHVRFVHDADCVLDVARVTLTPAGDDSFDATIGELKAAGLSPSRKYLVFVDANVYCGIAHIEDDDRASRSNLNTKGERIARIDAGCWSGDVATDYSDTDPPAGSYLATHWNVADSDFLVRTPQDLRGYVTTSRSEDSSTPWESRQGNSAHVLNRVERTGTGAYGPSAAAPGRANVAENSLSGAAPVASKQSTLTWTWVSVQCRDITGMFADARFAMTFTGELSA